ncbi:MAG: RNA methyltransferase [Oscillospiraceae bacterium]|nr:RNA methyltransferase [Oscillospiraceae bacterium]
MEEISSRKNQNVRIMRELFSNSERRRESGMFAVEGDHLCGETAGLDYKIKLFMFTEKAREKYPRTVEKACKKAEKILVITEEISEYISDTKAPQGLFMAVERRSSEMSENARKIVVLDGVQDPGNVGTIIRTAEALGIEGAVFTGKCADAFSPKTLRASMGSALRMPLGYANEHNLREMLGGFSIFAAMLDESAKKLGEIAFPEKTAVVIGSEGSGVSPEIAALCDEKVYIPIKKAESLNAAAAAAIILWELSKN